MPFTLRPYYRFPGQGTVWNLSRSRWRLSGNLPMRPGVTLSLTVTLANEQRISHTKARLQHPYVKRLVQEPAEIVQ